MAKKSKIPNLTNQITGTKVSGLSLPTSLKPTTPSGLSDTGSGKVGKVPSFGDRRTLSLGTTTSPTAIRFGRPSNSKTSVAQSGSAWTTLLKQTISGGASSGLAGELSSLGGIGGLFSGIVGLFTSGKKSSPPPLVDFQLPSSVSKTVYVRSGGLSMREGNSSDSPVASVTQSRQVDGSQHLQYQSAAIAQAVKTALLNSSSLNDVIAEI